MPIKRQVFPSHRTVKALLYTVLVMATSPAVSGVDSARTVPMHEKGTSTFYVEVSIVPLNLGFSNVVGLQFLP